mgnify:CR=1 FL=1
MALDSLHLPSVLGGVLLGAVAAVGALQTGEPPAAAVAEAASADGASETASRVVTQVVEVPAEAEVTDEALEQDLALCQFNEKLLRSRLQLYEGVLGEWTEEIPEHLREDAVREQLEGLLVDFPGWELRALSCEEYPCLYVLFAEEATRENAKELAGARGQLQGKSHYHTTFLKRGEHSHYLVSALHGTLDEPQKVRLELRVKELASTF